MDLAMMKRLSPPVGEAQIPDVSVDFNFEAGRTVSMVIHDGTPIAVCGPIQGIPLGLEPLVKVKNFYFEEVKLGFLECDHDLRFSYNVYIDGGSRIFFIANPSRLDGIGSSRFYTYVVLAENSEDTIMIWEGDQYGGCADVCCFCCACDGRRGIRVLYNNVEIGRFSPVHGRVMPCLFSCATCCYCYIDKYAIEFREDPDSKTRRFVSKKAKGSGLQVIDPGDRSLVATISSTVIPGIKKNRVLPAELVKSNVVGGEVKVHFSLSLTDPQAGMHPNGKAVLLALAMFHESEVMKSQRRGTEDQTGALVT